MCDFVEGQLLADQVKSVKEVAEYVSQLRRVGKVRACSSELLGGWGDVGMADR